MDHDLTMPTGHGQLVAEGQLSQNLLVSVDCCFHHHIVCPLAFHFTEPLQVVSENIQTQPLLISNSSSKKWSYLHSVHYQLSITSKISQLFATMFNAVNKLFTPQEPPCKVVGIRLTKDDTTRLIITCNGLVRCLNTQLEAIRDLPTLSEEQAYQAIRSIQNRQIHMNVYVATIISRTTLSDCPWINEFVDARTALGGKLRTINKASKVGWLPAARRYWPCMMETYEWLLPLTLKLRDESEEALQEQQQQQQQQ
jgi:hypothetical protein